MLEECVYIISDEIHSDFIYPGYKHIPVASISNEIADRTITCLSPTKTFNPEGLLQYLEQNIALLRTSFSEDAPVYALNPEGTYLARLDCRRIGISDIELADLFLNQAKVHIHSGTTFGAGGSDFVRMNIAYPKPLLVKAISQIESAIKNIFKELLQYGG